MESKTLHLTLKCKWFDMILSGKKKEEYREVKEFWAIRLIAMNYCLVIDRAGNKYDSIKSSWWYCIGLCGSRIGAAKYLISTCASFKNYDTITFTHGYAKNARKMVVECKGIDIGTARPEWSDNWQGDVFIIKLGEILKTENI